jgi:large subunit ribosomal protein L10
LAISRARKEELVAKYVETLSESDGFVIAHYHAMTVAETEQLRHRLRENTGEYMITKNTLLKIALAQSDWPVPEGLLQGPVGVCFSKGNMPGLTKAVMDFAKDFESKFTIIGGVMGGDVFQAEQAEAISKLPTLEELQPQIIGMLIQPQQGLVNTLHAADAQIVNVLHPAVSQIVNVLDAHINQNLKGEDDAA